MRKFGGFARPPCRLGRGASRVVGRIGIEGLDASLGCNLDWHSITLEEYVRRKWMHGHIPGHADATYVTSHATPCPCRGPSEQCPPCLAWIEQVFRTLKHLLATDACQVHSEDAYYGHLVLRLMASFVLYYASRVLRKGRATMDEIICNVRYHLSSVDCQELELYGLA
jgi:hypothetical protein